jgi:ABC-2 type transport system ATP-binding protein
VSAGAGSITTQGLGKRYGRVWALAEASIEIPAGRISGLVGANGAGKTTLLRLLAGLSRPTTGSMVVADRAPADDPAFLAEVGYLAQEVPLYATWTADDHLALGAHLNPTWDDEIARDRLRALGIPLDRAVRKLSGGMRAQVGLALALGKRPRVLLLDEPVAALDPLARREFLASLVGAVAERGMTVLLSTHLLPDLERVCDHLVLIADARPVLCADIDELLRSHKLLTGARSEASISALARDHRIIQRADGGRDVRALVALDGPLLDTAWRVDDLDLEEIVLAYLGRDAASRRELTAVTA